MVIFVVKENGSSIIATLCDVVWVVGRYDAGNSWHGVNGNAKRENNQLK